MHDRDDIDLLLQDAVNDAIRILKQLAERLLVILRNHRSQVGLIGQLPASLEDSFHQALGVPGGTPADEDLDGVQIG
jgi:hypothetical protein